MKRTGTIAIELAMAIAAVGLFGGADWTNFRGNDNRSISEETRLPVAFDESSNVAWKIPLPGRGPSSPIVAGGRVVVTASSGSREDRLHVLCFDAKTGKRQWHRQLWATGHTVVHPFGANAAPTAATDGELIFAFFSSNDLACFDFDGNLKWFRGLAHDYPTVRNDVGMASSPLAIGPTVIVQLSSQTEALAFGIDKTSGETRWRIEREKGAVWSSPTVLRGKTTDEDVVLLQSRSRLTAHHPHTGKLLWEYEAACHTIASVTTCGDTAYLPSHGLHALKFDPDRRGAELLWHQSRLSSGNASPIVHEGRAYTIKDPGILACGDTVDGKILWQLRLKGPFWASAVIADGHLYCVNYKDGLVQVVELAEKGKLVGTSWIDPKILASPAVANGAVYFRSDEHLWKIAFP